MASYPLEDILQSAARGHSSDIRWSMKDFKPTQYKWKREESARKLVEHVRNSKKVAFQVKQVCMEQDLSEEHVWSQVEAILHEMAHNFALNYVRFFGYVLTKVFRKLYSHIYVDKESIMKLKSLVQDYPIILVPNHRSYIDFLLISYTFYNYDLPLPSIAAAMDFMGMGGGVGQLLRNSGAFFIRRTFAADRLYWGVFTEYVQSIVCAGHSPVEFFLEGTRSRSGKSLPPKLGCLTAVLEPYLTGRVHNIYFVPITISYGRVLEEKLHAYELLGVPKPKESTTGLFKAAKVLSEDYGNIFITFAPPVSVRSYFQGKVDRSVHNLTPRFIPMSYTSHELSAARELALDLLCLQQSRTVVSATSLYAAAVLAAGGHQPLPQTQPQPRHLQPPQLLAHMRMGKQLVESFGYRVDWNGSATVVDSLLSAYPYRDDHSVATLNESLTHNDNVNMMLLVYYKNHLMHIFIHEAIVLSYFLAEKRKNSLTVSTGELREHYLLMRDLLQKEVVFRHGDKCLQELDSAISRLKQCNLLHGTSSSVGGAGVGGDEEVLVLAEGGERQAWTVTLLSSMLQPLITAYWVVIQYVLHASSSGGPVSVSRCQHVIHQLLVSGLVGRSLEMLSLTLIRHILATLSNPLSLITWNSKTSSITQVKMKDLFIILSKLEKQINIPDLEHTKWIIAKLCCDGSLSSKAKL